MVNTQQIFKIMMWTQDLCYSQYLGCFTQWQYYKNQKGMLTYVKRCNYNGSLQSFKV